MHFYSFTQADGSRWGGCSIVRRSPVLVRVRNRVSVSFSFSGKLTLLTVGLLNLRTIDTEPPFLYGARQLASALLTACSSAHVQEIFPMIGLYKSNFFLPIFIQSPHRINKVKPCKTWSYIVRQCLWAEFIRG